MSENWKVHRVGLFWLLLAFVSVIAIHFEHLPLWVGIAAVITIVWRIQLYRGAWSPPGKFIRLTLVVVCLAGLLLEYRSLIGLEPMVAMLASAFALKLLEMRNRRDSYVVVFLAFFLAILQALFEQTIATALYIAACLLLVTAALTGLHQHRESQRPLLPFKTAAVLLLQAVPLMILLFMVMPRIGALWSVPLNSHSAKTGVSNTMSPGDFSKLGRSAELAFRVSFEGEAPPQYQLYWRGLVLSNFDGREWSSAGPDGFEGSLLQWFGGQQQPWDRLIERRGEPVSYQVMLEPSQQPWLYALSTPKPSNKGAALTRDFRLIYKHPVVAKTAYQVQSWLDYRLSPDQLPRWRRTIELAIPDGYNPKTVALARQWRLETPDNKALMQRVLGLYNQEFIYTLKPPLLGKNTVDEFLFEAKRGFCEHFASSFVFFMRAAGVPARVVVGYQGGEIHPEGYLLVRQYDAHAWAEVWLEGEGWVRVDPTAAVAPERIETSLTDILGEEEDFLADSPLSLMRFRDIGWLNSMRLQLESLNYAWARWVLGYNREQENILQKWLGGTSPTHIGLALLFAGGLILGIVAFLQLKNATRQPADELDRLFLKFCYKLEKAGLKRQVGEGPQAFTERIAGYSPEMGRKVQTISHAYQQMRYGDRSWSNLLAMKKAVRDFRANKVRIGNG